MAVLGLTGFSEIEPIARGGYSEIFRARDDLTGRLVALKVIDARDLPTRARSAFARESAALGSLSSHPHIVTLYQAMDLHDRLVLVLELCRESAQEQVSRGLFDVATTLSYGVKLASALATAHSRDMVHRDVKPQNVLITSYGEPALADFGIARLAASSHGTTATGLRAFTAVHAPPELLQGGTVDARSDIYELGSTLYTLLAGVPPFAGEPEEPVATTILRIIREPVPVVERPDLPEALMSLLERMLAKDVDDRPRAALDLAIELNSLESHLGLTRTPVVVGDQELPGSEAPHRSASTSWPLGATAYEADPSEEESGSGRPVRPPPENAARGWRRHNLPNEASSFIGREVVLGDVRALLDSARIVTLTGVGGTGKTRIAVQLGYEAVGTRRDGVFFVDLSPLGPVDSVSAAIADTVGARVEAGRTTTESFAFGLGDADCLMILDNCEHLLDQCAGLVATLVRGCPGVSVLATSREPLGLAGEHLYPVPPMSLPDAPGVDAVAESEAGALFATRAAGQHSQFRLDSTTSPVVARICRRLDGIPLAVELAVSRLRSLSLRDLDTRLDHMFSVLTSGSRSALPRQRTLRATIEWSYELLTENERSLLDRLSVFADGFGIDAAEQVCGPSVGGEVDVIDLLSSLVDKSLVQLEASEGESRYRLLETIRAFAAERLEERPEDAARHTAQAHASYFLVAAVGACELSDGAEREVRFDALRADHENLHAAVRYFVSADGGIDDALRLCAALFPYWKRGGHYVEGAKLLQRCLSTAEHTHQQALRAACLHATGSLLYDCGSPELARRSLEEGAVIAAAEREFRVLAGCRHEIALALFRQGAYEEALRYIEASFVMAEQSGDEEFLARASCDRGKFTTGHPERSRADLERALSHFRSEGNLRMIATALDGTAHLEIEEGNLEAARALLTEGLEHAIAAHDDDQVQVWALNLAFTTLLTGDAPGALVMARRAARVIRRTGSAPLFCYVLLAAALCLSAIGDRERAARLHGSADAHLEAHEQEYEPLEFRLREEDLSAIRDDLGEGVFALAYADGRSLGFADALCLAGIDD